MPTPSSKDGERDAQRDRPPGKGGGAEDVLRPPARPRASPLRLLAIATASIIVSLVVFRLAVEALRSLTAR
jgi:hypothetical protein